MTNSLKNKNIVLSILVAVVILSIVATLAFRKNLGADFASAKTVEVILAEGKNINDLKSKLDGFEYERVEELEFNAYRVFTPSNINEEDVKNKLNEIKAEGSEVSIFNSNPLFDANLKFRAPVILGILLISLISFYLYKKTDFKKIDRLTYLVSLLLVSLGAHGIMNLVAVILAKLNLAKYSLLTLESIINLTLLNLILFTLIYLLINLFEEKLDGESFSQKVENFFQDNQKNLLIIFTLVSILIGSGMVVFDLQNRFLIVIVAANLIWEIFSIVSLFPILHSHLSEIASKSNIISKNKFLKKA